MDPVWFFFFFFLLLHMQTPKKNVNRVWTSWELFHLKLNKILIYLLATGISFFLSTSCVFFFGFSSLIKSHPFAQGLSKRLWLLCSPRFKSNLWYVYLFTCQQQIAAACSIPHFVCINGSLFRWLHARRKIDKRYCVH